MTQKNNKVLVIGGGMGGLRSTLDLAATGRDAILIDKDSSIGGLMTMLDRTFPTNNCDLCTLSSTLSETGRQKHIQLKTLTQLEDLKGEAGNFKVTLKTKPRYIDIDKCTGCGDCYKMFKECVNFSPGLDHRAPTCMRYPQAIPQAFSIDIEKCQDINKISELCQANAIIPDDTEKIEEIEVGSIILASGAELFNPNKLDNFGSGNYPNVVTGLEYERIMSASGPTLGNLERPSDQKKPKRIAWIQCVGSRTNREGENPYCSSVCCMYALKEAIVTKERFQDDIETVIFYMDMRTSGKGYQQYQNRAEDEYGVKFIRSRPHSIIQDTETKNLSLRYTLYDSSKILDEEFDMVVLSTGFCIPDTTKQLLNKLEIDVNEYSFVKTSSFHPVETSKKGIYVCGISESPKDIPETMVQGSAAACLASAYSDITNDNAELEELLPPERNVENEDPAIGVFICDCGNEINDVISVSDIEKYTKDLPNVKISEIVGHGCSSESLKHIQSVIQDQQLNRIVIAACSPRTHSTIFQDAIRKAGLNKYLVEIVNIRDQDAWVHKDQPEKAIKKAKTLIRMAVASVVKRHALIEYVLPVNKDVLVIGGGVSGMNSALLLADYGFKIFLIEQASQLGGVSKRIKRTISGEDVQLYLTDLIEKTVNHDNIEVLTDVSIVDHKGMVGRFTTGVQIKSDSNVRFIEHGVTIIATGAIPGRPKEYLLNEHKAVVTQCELDSVIAEQPESIKKWDNIVMIQCVGSRSEENPGCSRICCQTAIKNALNILEINPDVRIFIIYRDIRTYGFYEDYYRKAREKGVVFLRYEPENKPKVKESGDQILVTFKDLLLDRNVEITADCLALSTGLIAPEEENEKLASVFQLCRTTDGYFLENHIKLRPVDMTARGFLVAGTAHGPKTIRESIAQSQAAAGRAMTFLANKEINLGAGVAIVDGDKCASCLICVRECPYDVPFINADGYSEIDPTNCHGCGICVAACPAKAIQLMQFEDDVILAALSGLIERI